MSNEEKALVIHHLRVFKETVKARLGGKNSWGKDEASGMIANTYLEMLENLATGKEIA